MDKGVNSGSCYAYFPNISNIDKGVKFYIRWFNGSMQTIKESSYEIPLLESEKWQRVFHTEVAPADASYATARVALIRNGSVYPQRPDNRIKNKHLKHSKKEIKKNAEATC